MDVSETLAPRSDQVNADDLTANPRTVRILDVRPGTTEQPVEVVTDVFGDGRPYKPGKSMRRVMAAAWGTDSTAWVGKSMTLFNDTTIRFGPDTTGGIRISHMSGIDKPLSLPLTVTRGKRKPYKVQPLPDAPAPQADPIAEAKTRLWNAWTSFNEPDAAALTAAFKEATGADLSTATPEQMHEYADTLTTGEATEEDTP